MIPFTWNVTNSFCKYSAEHFSPLLEQISKLEEALHNIQFEQHWLEAQTDRQAIGKGKFSPDPSSYLSIHKPFIDRIWTGIKASWELFVIVVVECSEWSHEQESNSKGSDWITFSRCYKLSPSLPSQVLVRSKTWIIQSLINPMWVFNLLNYFVIWEWNWNFGL